MLEKETIKTWFEGLQDSICAQLETADGGGKFREDVWQREGGGGGRTRLIEGNIIERGGVNFSAVFGHLPEKASRALGFDGTSEFFASGVSIVLHPRSPMVPIIHMNVRYFETDKNSWWFGGGIDLTPHYIDFDDAHFFHQNLKSICDKHHSSYYPEFKKWADDYFYLGHREETRGVGGIFFDHLKETPEISKEARWEFVKDVGRIFAPIYVELMKCHANKPYGEREKAWQSLRRGRYVEFNLVLDRGTKFGLETNGRTESILMSMPPMARWEYCHKPEANSREAHTLAFLKKDINWV